MKYESVTVDVFIDEPCQWKIRVPKEGKTKSTKTAVTFSIEASMSMLKSSIMLDTFPHILTKQV